MSLSAISVPMSWRLPRREAASTSPDDSISSSIAERSFPSPTNSNLVSGNLLRSPAEPLGRDPVIHEGQAIGCVRNDRCVRVIDSLRYRNVALDSEQLEPSAQRMAYPEQNAIPQGFPLPEVMRALVHHVQGVNDGDPRHECRRVGEQPIQEAVGVDDVDPLFVYESDELHEGQDPPPAWLVMQGDHLDVGTTRPSLPVVQV